LLLERSNQEIIPEPSTFNGPAHQPFVKFLTQRCREAKAQRSKGAKSFLDYYIQSSTPNIKRNKEQYYETGRLV
jgi:hypothetical protein